MSGILSAFIGRVAGVVTDAYFNLVTLLLPGNGTNGAQNNTFLDSSTNNFTITRNGNTTQGTFSPFSQTGWSNYFNGSGDWLSIASNAAFGFGTGDYTVEFWIYLSASPASGSKYTLLDFRTSSTAIPHTCYVGNSSGTLYMGFFNGTSDVTSSSQPLTTNSWFHVAYARASGTLRIYVNGVQAYSAANTIDYQSSRPLNIGASVDTVTREPLNGYLSNLRVVKGRAVYTSAFTPPTEPLGATSGGQNPPTGTETSLLTCQSNRFVDNGGLTTRNTITPTGTSVQAFSPFAPTAAYSAATVGGSGYFDGSGDYLSAPSSADFGFGTGDFTLECWVYPLASTAQRLLFGGGDMNNIDIGFSPADTFQYYNGAVQNTGVSAASRQWFHIAVSRISGTTSIYVNGTRTNNFSDTSSTSTRQYYIGGSNTGTNPFNGYISDVRIIKGTGIYSGTTITVPTAPLTAVTNTKLLCNFTNAGITDATAKNVLETVGNAQISTTQSKFGGSSMYFDGSGDGLILPASPFYNFLDGNFTVEAWVYIAGNSPLDGLSRRIANVFSVSTSSAFSFNFIIRGDGTTTGTGLEIYNGTNIVNVTGTISQSTWHHIAVTKSGTSVYFFLNGTQMGATQTTSGNWGSATVAAQVGRAAVTSYTFDLNGYIDDLRITKGLARYTASFTPPTAAFATQ